MKYARVELPDGRSWLVSATGRPLGKKDVDYPVLHVLPRMIAPEQMFRDGYASLRRKDVSLKVKSSPIDMTPSGGVIVRQPHPNPRYFVGGSKQSRNGWLVPIPLGATEFTVEFLWNTKGGGG